MALRVTAPRLSAQKLLVKQRMREREGKEFIPGRIIWDELTQCGPGNFPIQPPAPINGPLGWKKSFYERGLQDVAKDFDSGLFAMKVEAALAEEFAKIEKHPPATETHHKEGGKIFMPFQPRDSERLQQTCSSIPKDKYELEKFIQEKRDYHNSELFSIIANDAWQVEQKRSYNNANAGSMTEDARVLDLSLTEEESGRLFGGQVAQAFILGWISMLMLTLVWRIK